jgi:hypothetical protein
MEGVPGLLSGNLCLFMFLMFSTQGTILGKHQFAFNRFFILARIIVVCFANTTLELDEIFLTHSENTNLQMTRNKNSRNKI